MDEPQISFVDKPKTQQNWRPQKVSCSYKSEWENLCRMQSLEQLQFISANGYLTNCRFTSLCWNMLLKVLPVDPEKWLLVLQENRRQYESTKQNVMVTPSTQEGLDLNVHNPLSQSEENSWNRYFEDSELKKLIRLDVSRVFPNEPYFQQAKVQEILVSILFCFSRKNSLLSYVQGMHEVLAPLLFVSQLDRDTCKNTSEDTRSDLLLAVMDEKYLEHDTFILFENVMARLSHWYEQNEQPSVPKMDPRTKLITAQPFAKSQESLPTPKIVQRLMRLQDVYLKVFEPDVYNHLTKNEVLPQVYGIRWGRLIVGREFVLYDLLVIWDAVFSDNSHQFELLDFIMIAMLSYIKDKLLNSDYSCTLKLLMNYPSSPDVRAIIKKAKLYQTYKDSPSEMENLNACDTRSTGSQMNRRFVVTNFSRSTSVSRKPDTIGSLSQKTQPLERCQSLDRRKSTPTVEATHSKNVTIHHKSKSKQQKSIGENGKTAVFSAMLHREKESEFDPLRSDNYGDQQLKEIAVIKRSEPIPTKNHILSNNHSTSADSDEAPHIASSRERLKAEDLLTTSLNCATRLEHYQGKLRSRLRDMNLESDLCLRNVIDGISEVILSLRESRLRPRNPSGPDPYSTEFEFTPHRSKLVYNMQPESPPQTNRRPFMGGNV